MNKINIQYLLFFYLFFLTWTAQAQDNLLKRKVTVKADEKPLENILLDMSDMARFTFSYDASILSKSNDRVSFTLENESVKATLDKILPEDIDYKVSGNHLILLKKATEYNSGKKEKYTVSGHVYSTDDNAPLENIIVYEVSSLVSSLTDSEGRFSMVIPAEFKHFGLSFNHQYFHDKVIFVAPKNQTLAVALEPKREKKDVEKLESLPFSPSPVESLSIVRTLVSPQLFIRTRNMDMVRQTTAQFSFLPAIGTNLKMGGLIENNFSLNVLAGYAYGVNKLEIGGLVNIIRKDVKGVQVAGMGNIVGQNTHGIQLSGIFNHNRGSLRGVQVTGVYNMLKDSLNGVQVAGMSNIAKGHMKGVQLSGTHNFSGESVEGTQVSGLVNLAAKDVQAVQVAGLYNKAGQVGGTQIAGLANFSTDTVKGVQLAGLVNKAKTVEVLQLSGIANIAHETVAGTQIGGLFNYAQYVGGSQLGLVNIADSASGIPVGFFSFIKQGHHRLEFSVTEILPANIAFKTGVKNFYNIFTGGIGTWAGASRLSLGYGLGTERSLSEKVALNFELTNHIIYEHLDFQEDFNSLMRLDINLVRTKSRSIGFSVGPSLNFMFTDVVDYETEQLTQLAPYTLIDTEIGRGFGQMWIGGKVTAFWEF